MVVVCVCVGVCVGGGVEYVIFVGFVVGDVGKCEW